MKLSLRYKIISIFILAVVLPAILFGVVLTSISRKSLKDSIFYQQQEIVKRLADRINSQIDRHQKLLITFRDISAMARAKQIETARDILALGPSFTEISLIDAKGIEIFKYKRGEGLSKELFSKPRRELVKLPQGNIFISQVYFSNKRHPFIVLAAPLAGGDLIADPLDADRSLEFGKG